MNKTETWLIPADFHWKFVDKSTLEKLHKVAKEIKPDVLCSLGDEVDYDGISKFTLKHYGDGLDECEEELKSFKLGWEELVKSCGNPKQIMCLGNHNGERVEKMLYKLESRKMSREAKDVKHSLDFKLNFPDVKIVPYNSYIKKNGLILTHGEFHNDNHTKTHALRYNCDVVYGHMHSVNCYSLSQKGSNKVKKAISLPCMCNTNPRYRGNKSSAWTNGFAVITFYDATYSIEIIEVKNNKAIFRGKEI